MMSLNGKHVRKDAMNPTELYVGADLHERETQVAVFEKDGTLLLEKDGTLLLEKRLPIKSLREFVSSLPGRGTYPQKVFLNSLKVLSRSTNSQNSS